MESFNSAKQIQNSVDNFRKQGKIIGFVPTMGALHEGHLSLIRKAKQETDIVVCSIFVNPTQFNDKKDLEKYPRTIEKDMALLNSANTDLLFHPSVEEVYPQPDKRQFDFGPLGNVMEGAHRPGHFNGVAQVVSRLFDIVQPDKAYFGQKDFQQLAIIKAMVQQLKINVKIIACATMRENDGLAMSSRNIRLSPEERKVAPFISGTLFKIQESASKLTVKQLKEMALSLLSAQPRMQVEYFEIADSITLQPVDILLPGKEYVACVALKLGTVRLIDNVLLNL